MFCASDLPPLIADSFGAQTNYTTEINVFTLPWIPQKIVGFFTLAAEDTVVHFVAAGSNNERNQRVRIHAERTIGADNYTL